MQYWLSNSEKVTFSVILHVRICIACQGHAQLIQEWPFNDH